MVANEVPAQSPFACLTGQVVLTSYSLVLNPVSSPPGPVLTPSGVVLGDVAAVPAVAVTGNVFVDPTNLPARPAATIPSPLGDWDMFNTVIGYGLTAPPAVTQVAPATGPAGNTVTVTGTGFTGATAVSFGTTPATTFTPSSSSPDTELIVIVPVGSGTVNVTVTTPSGTSPTVPADEFTFLAVTGINPPGGQPPLTVSSSAAGSPPARETPRSTLALTPAPTCPSRRTAPS